MVICLERCADLHMAQLMPLPLTVPCFSKVQIGFTFLVPAHPGSPEQRAVKRVYVCVCVVVHKLASGLDGTMMSVGQSSSSHAHLWTLQTSPAYCYCMACHVEIFWYF